MGKNVRAVSGIFLIVAFLLLTITAPSSAELYGIEVSNVGDGAAPSPDRQWLVSVNFDWKGLPFLNIQKSPDGVSQNLVGVTRSGWVLWSPDSRKFAFTDAAFSDKYLVYLCSVAPTGTLCSDISSEIEARVRKKISVKFDIDRMYLKALKWHSPNTLIVGVHAIISPKMKPGQTHAPAYYRFEAFSIDAKTARIEEELTKKQARLYLGASLDQLKW
ncbi:MAG: hypothetical protein AB9866_06730 [Syntrophobacteraceae bacterium]